MGTDNKAYLGDTRNPTIIESNVNPQWWNGTNSFDIHTTGSIRINGGVLEFWDGSAWKGAGGGIKNVQRGTTATSGSAAITPITITAVNPAKTFLTCSIRSASGTAQVYNVTLELVDATSLRIYMAGTVFSNLTMVAWEVVEFL